MPLRRGCDRHLSLSVASLVVRSIAGHGINFFDILPRRLDRAGCTASNLQATSTIMARLTPRCDGHKHILAFAAADWSSERWVDYGTRPKARNSAFNPANMYREWTCQGIVLRRCSLPVLAAHCNSRWARAWQLSVQCWPRVLRTDHVATTITTKFTMLAVSGQPIRWSLLNRRLGNRTAGMANYPYRRERERLTALRPEALAHGNAAYDLAPASINPSQTGMAPVGRPTLPIRPIRRSASSSCQRASLLTAGDLLHGSGRVLNSPGASRSCSRYRSTRPRSCVPHRRGIRVVTPR